MSTPAIDEGREWAATMPNASFEVLDAGHVPWLDDPAGHARRIEAFLGAAQAYRLRFSGTTINTQALASELH